MNSPLIHTPTYLGVWITLTLGIACNLMGDLKAIAFLPGLVIFFIAFGVTLWFGWSQKGVEDEHGRKARKVATIVGGIFTIVALIPMFGMPAAGVYVMAVLQMAENCVMVSRRHVYRALLISAGMVIYACMQYYANWTLFIYLIPYVIAMTFTLVASQISQRMQDVKLLSSGSGTTGAQGVAILSATVAILMTGLVLYSVTPQVTWPFMKQQTNMMLGQGLPGGGGDSGYGEGKAGLGERIGNLFGSLAGRQPWNKWPDDAEIERVIGKTELMDWQKDFISAIAHGGGRALEAIQASKQQFSDAIQSLKDWLAENKRAVAGWTLLFIVLALIAAAFLFLRETRPMLWLRCRFDYFYLCSLQKYGADRQSAAAFYYAMERVLALRALEREPLWTVRQYASYVARLDGAIASPVQALTRDFELIRYGTAEVQLDAILRIKSRYAEVFNGAS